MHVRIRDSVAIHMKKYLIYYNLSNYNPMTRLSARASYCPELHRVPLDPWGNNSPQPASVVPLEAKSST